MQGNLATEERLRWLSDRLEEAGRIEIAGAAADLGVSEMTIRRDLQELEGRGQLRRVRGGALPLGPLPFADRHRTRAKAKSRIAAKLVPLLPATGAVGFDARAGHEASVDMSSTHAYSPCRLRSTSMPFDR